jgi:hypothetical protein
VTDDFAEGLLAAIEQRERAGERALPHATGSRYEGQPADWVHFITGAVSGILTICAEHRALVERYLRARAQFEHLDAKVAIGNADERDLQERSNEAARSTELLAVLHIIAGSYGVQPVENALAAPLQQPLPSM